MGVCSSSSAGGEASSGSGGGASSTAPSFDYEAQLASSTFGPYSVVVNSSEQRPGETGIHRSPATAHAELCTAVYPNEAHPCTTLWNGFERGVRVSGGQPCLGTRLYQLDGATGRYRLSDGMAERGDYVWSPYAEVHAEAKEVGAGLAALGLTPGESNVGIYGKNRHEWVTGAWGTWSQSMRVVALYDTFGADSIQYIIAQAELGLILVSRENLPTILKVAPSCPRLKHIVQFDSRQQWQNVEEGVSQQDVDAFAALDIRLISFTALRSLGQTSTNIFPAPPTPATVAYIMYTSGTTGNPKGAIITHQGLVSSVAASRDTLPFENTDVHLSYLPLAHVFECGIMCVMLFAGCRVGFWSGQLKQMNGDLTTLRPTALFGVPRVYQRIYQRVMQQMNDAGGLKSSLAHRALASSTAEVRSGNSHFSGLLSNYVFGSIRAKLGLDRCRFIVTSAAPCPPYLQEFFNVLLNGAVIQGYGMTEASCVIGSTRAGDFTRGHVGGPLSCCEVKLVDVPDMNYHSTDQPLPRGEIWVRGPQVFKGYFKEPQLTAEAVTEDGWLRTGDVGRWNRNGSLSIIDRKKNILKLSQGEYVPVEKVEAVYGKCPAITSIFLYGNSFKSFIVGIVVPNVEYWYKQLSAQQWWSDPSIRIGDERFPAAFAAAWQSHEAELKAALVALLKAQEKDVNGIERARDWLVEYRVDRDGNAWTPVNSLMTPTFKVRRPQMVHHYVQPLKQLYANNGEPAAAGEHWPGE